MKDPKAIDFLEKSMIVLTGTKLESNKDTPTSVPQRNGRSKLRSDPVFVPNPYLLAEESRNNVRTERRRATVQRSVDAIIESALAASRTDSDSLPVENCIPASTLLESSMETSDYYESPSESTDLHKSPSNDLDEVDTNQDTNGTMASSLGSANTRCRLCGKHFRKRSGLEDHMKSKHSCDESDSFEVSSESHQVSHSSPNRNSNGIAIVHSAITPIARFQQASNKVRWLISLVNYTYAYRELISDRSEG